MDDSLRAFVNEFKSGILRKRVGQIALAVVLAEACIRFLNALIWYFVVPLIAWLLEGHTESVLFKRPLVFPWQQIFGSFLEFIVALIFVFYVNRWIRGALPQPALLPSPELSPPDDEEEGQEPYYNLAGQLVSPTEQEGTEK